MTFTLCLSALLKFLLGVVLVAALLFIPAGTLNYPNAILLMVILFVPMFLAGLVLMVKNPDLLRRRLKVKEEQKVINTGLYGLVRHPMYSATIILFLTMPLVLGSLIAFLVFLPYPIMIIKRLKNEEQVLSKELTGYTEYQKKVRYRLIPYIW
ncbi:methyltransferase family protein [Streptococcus alactolyticus]|uniref:Isoprenylcysteine carboxylmethyltransferase family protein n=1 Tax=Streptococcus alactolyticus TaxID=29389 RepID=A0ABY7LVJ4_STRAY|nr:MULTISPECIES: isoprenylcysteine carboxylmethyltransferase family protein [Streptococcus]WBB05632.1 isoprenylcysteine carboxylmethyltransferase family protein [Streptococcus alactolyticus]